MCFSMIGLGLIMLMTNCTKEATETKKAENPLTQNNVKIGNLIKAFKSKVAHYEQFPDLKSSEKVSVDTAQWLLEATMNYSHAFPNEFYNEFETDSVMITLQRNADGSVNMDELTQKYNEMKQAVSDIYHQVEYTDKGLAVVDLKTSTISETQLSLNAQTITGNKGIKPPPPVMGGPFQQGDNWWFGEFGGSCSGNGPTGSDAADQLYIELLKQFPELETNSYSVNLFNFSIEGGDSRIRRTAWNDIEDNHLDYLLYFSSTAVGPCGNDTLCVEWNEMNLYYSFLKHLIFNYLPQNIPSLNGKTIDKVLLIRGFSTNNNGVVQFKHGLETIYSEKYLYAGSDGPIEL